MLHALDSDVKFISIHHLDGKLDFRTANNNPDTDIWKNCLFNKKYNGICLVLEKES